MPSLSLAIPSFNEEASIERTVHMYLDALREAASDFEIVLLDDGSTDGTRSIIDRLAAQHPGVIRPVYHERNLGIARACENAQRAAQKEFVLLLGADGQYGPGIIAACLARADRCDVVLCKRKQKHYGLYRALVSSVYRLLCRIGFGIDLHDPGAAKMFKRALLDTLPSRSKGVFKEPERAIRAFWGGWRLDVVEVECQPRRAGIARGCSLRLIVHALKDVGALWWEDRFLRAVRNLINRGILLPHHEAKDA